MYLPINIELIKKRENKTVNNVESKFIFIFYFYFDYFGKLIKESKFGLFYSDLSKSEYYRAKYNFLKFFQKAINN